MSELRKDPVSGRWIIIAADRAKRPQDWRFKRQAAEEKSCPFCEGNESTTPPEILAYRPSDSPKNGPGWRVRVVPNKFPALRIEGELNKRGVGLYDMQDGIGAHEVIIETPRHETTLTALSDENVEEVIHAYQLRLADLKLDKRLRFVLLFKNVGLAAGASLTHSHSQLIALPTVPRNVLLEMQGARDYYRFHERCIFCDLIKQEIEDQERVVIEGEEFVSLEPFAPRFPFETWIVPRHHASHFESMDPLTSAGRSRMKEFAQILKTTLVKLERALDSPPCNYVIHTSPFDVEYVEHYHWHVEIIPRLTRVAGFEWGTGFYINPVPPEEAAKFLQKLKV